MKRYVVFCKRVTTELVEVPVEVADNECSDHAEASVDLDDVRWHEAKRSVTRGKTAVVAE